MDAGKPGDQPQDPAGCRVVTLSRLKTLVVTNHVDQRREPVLVVVAVGLVLDLLGHGADPAAGCRPGR
jgi:hypothetical protein